MADAKDVFRERGAQAVEYMVSMCQREVQEIRKAERWALFLQDTRWESLARGHLLSERTDLQVCQDLLREVKKLRATVWSLQEVRERERKGREQQGAHGVGQPPISEAAIIAAPAEVKPTLVPAALGEHRQAPQPAPSPHREGGEHPPTSQQQLDLRHRLRSQQSSLRQETREQGQGPPRRSSRPPPLSSVAAPGSCDSLSPSSAVSQPSQQGPQ